MNYIQTLNNAIWGNARDMTYEEKTMLARAISKLNSAHLDVVVKMVQDLEDPFETDGIDINSLDKTTLWALHAYVSTAR